MNRRLLIGILIVVVGVILVGAGFIAISNMLRQTVTPPPQPTAVPVLTTQVVVTTHDLAVGSVLDAEDIQLIELPVAFVPRDASEDLESIIGRITTVHMIQGEMVLEHHLADPTNISHDIGYVIGDDQVLMAFPATDLMSTLNILQRGDIVDIYATINVRVIPAEVGPEATPAPVARVEQEEVTRVFTFDAMQRVSVSAVVVEIIRQEENQPQPAEGEAQPTPDPSDVIVRAYLLALDPQDALVLKHLRDTGATFDIVLRSPTSIELFDLSPVTTEYLVQRYELEVSR